MTVDWEHYQINLSPKPSAVSAKGGARPAMRVLAGPVTRLGAQLLDLALGLIPVVIAYLVTLGSADSQAASETRLYLALAGLVALGLIQVIVLTFWGQTLGKMAIGIRIVDFLSETNPGFYKAVVLRAVVPLLLICIPVGGAIFLVSDILFIFSEEHRCLHDRIAGTKVVEV